MKPEKWTDAPCPRCGAAEHVANPKWLRYQRERADLSLRDMAKRMDVSPAYVCDLEYGRRNITARILMAYERLAEEGA